MEQTVSCPAADAMQAARMLVGDRRLAAYFHLELRERKGVHLRDRSGALGLATAVELSPRVQAAPGDTPPPDGWIEFWLDRLECSAQRIELHWRLPIEGLSGSALVSRTGEAWVLDELKMSER